MVNILRITLTPITSGLPSYNKEFDSGVYAFNDVMEGEYKMTVSEVGFHTTTENVVISGATQTIKTALYELGYFDAPTEPEEPTQTGSLYAGNTRLEDMTIYVGTKAISDPTFTQSNNTIIIGGG